MDIKRFGLAGYPLGHSVSPLIHKEVMSLYGISGEYALYETKPAELKSGFSSVLKKLDGFNVTIPYKTEIIPLLDGLCGEAEIMQSVNTVAVRDGKLYGYNTDCIGFVRSLESAGIDTEGSVLICGSGGVSRMFAFVCAERGAEVTLAVRPTGREKAEKIKKEIKNKLKREISIISSESVNRGYDLIINGTPAGMYPDVDSSPLGKDAVSLSKAVFDAVYNPAETKLLSYARECGIKYVNGLPMLVWQAVAAQEIWNGIKVKSEDVEGIIKLCEKEFEKK